MKPGDEVGVYTFCHPGTPNALVGIAQQAPPLARWALIYGEEDPEASKKSKDMEWIYLGKKPLRLFMQPHGPARPSIEVCFYWITDALYINTNREWRSN